MNIRMSSKSATYYMAPELNMRKLYDPFKADICLYLTLDIKYLYDKKDPQLTKNN